MHRIILLVVVLLLFVAMAYKKEAFVGNLFGLRAEGSNEQSKLLSTMLYFKGEDEATYLDRYQETHPIDEMNEPLIMDRCIQFVYEGNNGGVDAIMRSMQTDRKCFVSDKIAFDYTNYYTVESKLKDALLQLYVDSNNGGYVPQFYGPVYVLMVQYPYIRTLRKNCSMLPKSLQWDSLHGKFSPKPIDDVSGCESVKADIEKKALRLEMYILMPTHDVVVRNGKRLVGGFKYKKWTDVRCNMRRLFAYNPGYVPGVYTVNPRSFDEKCQLACLNESDNVNKYACGARNSVWGNRPYASTVLGVRKVPSDRNEEKKHDYANLYLINPARMNGLFNMRSDVGIMRNCITPEPIPMEFNTRFNCAAVPVGSTPTTPQVTLKAIAGATFNIQFEGNRCLSYKNGELVIESCGPEKHKRWFVEAVAVAGEGEALYRIGTRVGTRKLYLTRNLNNVTVTYVIPRFTLFKPRTPGQLMLVNIARNTNRIDWNTNEQYCLTLVDGRVVYEATNNRNRNITLVPVSDEDQICGPDIEKSVYDAILQSAKEQLVK
jgi:hypothetical protein